MTIPDAFHATDAADEPPSGEAGGPADGHRTEIHVQRFVVTYEFPVVFTENLFAADNPVFAETLARSASEAGPARLAVFIDDGVAAAWPELDDLIGDYMAEQAQRLLLCAPPERVPRGEGAKNDPALVSHLQRRLVQLRMDRHAFVVGIGGGASLDLLGYVAATTHRGVRHVRVPTTVLAQNDSGVGVKNGVNAFGLKNLLGTFVPPFAVFNDAAFLARLPERERRAGMAEAVKVALIRDAGFFRWLEAAAPQLARFAAPPMAHLVRRCAELHMQQIAFGGDPFERGSARPLDFGHWAAHRLETLTDHALRHGEAVAIGVALDSRYSVLAGLLPAGGETRVCALLETLGFTLWHDALLARGPDGAPALLAGLEEFREHLGGALTITLLADLGRGVDVHAMDAGLILASIDWLRRRSEADAAR